MTFQLYLINIFMESSFPLHCYGIIFIKLFSHMLVKMLYFACLLNIVPVLTYKRGYTVIPYYPQGIGCKTPC